MVHSLFLTQEGAFTDCVDVRCASCIHVLSEGLEVFGTCMADGADGSQLSPRVLLAGTNLYRPPLCPRSGGPRAVSHVEHVDECLVGVL